MNPQTSPEVQLLGVPNTYSPGVGGWAPRYRKWIGCNPHLLAPWSSAIWKGSLNNPILRELRIDHGLLATYKSWGPILQVVFPKFSNCQIPFKRISLESLLQAFRLGWCVFFFRKKKHRSVLTRYDWKTGVHSNWWCFKDFFFATFAPLSELRES